MDPSTSILLVCPACKSRRQVPRQLVGKRIRCRQCTAELTVEAPEGDIIDDLLLAGEPVPRTATLSIEAHSGLGEDFALALAADSPLGSPAAKHPDEDYRVRPASVPPVMVKAMLLAPPLPDSGPPNTWVEPPENKTLFWAFTSGIFTFALQPNALPQWVVLSSLTLGSSWLLTFGARFLNSGYGAIGGGCLCATGFFIGIAACSYGAACLIAIIENTAYHLDKDGRWPEHDYREWLFHLLRLIYLLAMSGLVAALPITLASLASPMVAGVVAAVVIYLAFPVLLLSVLEANSPLWPVSPPILRTLRGDVGAWFAFYAVSGLMWLGYAASSGALNAFSPGLGLLVSSALGAAAWFSFARLIGRLAAIIMHLDEREAERAAAKAK